MTRPPIDRPALAVVGRGGDSVTFHRRRLSKGFAVTVVAMIVATGCVALIGAPWPSGHIEVPNSPTDSGQGAAVTRSPWCQTDELMPTALLIPNINPSISVAVGDRVDVTFEFNVNYTTVPATGLKVYTPTVFVTMPVIGGGSFPVTFNNYT